MSLKEPCYLDEKGHTVHETWEDGKLVEKEIFDLGDNDHRYYEQITYDEAGNKKFHQVREPTPHGFNTLEENYDKGFLTSQKEEIDGNPALLKIRTFYPQITPDGTHLDKEILRRETIVNQTTGEVKEKEFSLTGEEMVPEKKKVPLSMTWGKHLDR